MAIIHKKTCSCCADSKPSDCCIPIGQDVLIKDSFTGDTDHSFLQCQTCGSIIVRTRDLGGVGGHGTFFKRLTQGLF